MNKETGRRWAMKRDEDGGNTVELFATIDGTEYRVMGYGLRSTDQNLANRLGRAWTAKAFYKKLVVKPCNRKHAPGQFYVECPTRGDYMPLGRMLNADLKRLGF